MSWLVWILVSRLFYAKQDAHWNVWWSRLSKHCKNNSSPSKTAKHTEREKNTCKQAAVHTPPTIINTLWHRQPKASIIVLILHPLQLSAGNFIFCLLVDFVLSSSGKCWQSLNLICSHGWKLRRGGGRGRGREQGHFRNPQLPCNYNKNT